MTGWWRRPSWPWSASWVEPVGLAAAMGMDGASAVARVEGLLREPPPAADAAPRIAWGVAAWRRCSSRPTSTT